MDTYVCKVCGYVSFGSAPDNCPVCHAPKTAFSLDNAAIKKPTDAKNLNDSEKKHIPVISIVRKCGLVGPGCIDINIKVGEILHVMEAKHFIMYIDVYLDPLSGAGKNFIARYHMVPEKINPVLGMHLKVDKGSILVLENCNVHGRWINEAEI